MKIIQQQYKNNSWQYKTETTDGAEAQLVLAFGSRELVANSDRFSEIKSLYPNATIVMVSTSGEILGPTVEDGTIALSALVFSRAHVQAVSELVHDASQSREVSRRLTEQLPKDNLRHVLVFTDGLVVNGSEVALGIRDVLPEGVTATGGMAGDADRFSETCCGLNDVPVRNNIIIVGLYGSLEIAHGSYGGWEPFGVERTVTKSKGNIVYELDHEPILNLYKKYLGELAQQLPASGLLFPLNIRQPDTDVNLVRTLLSINEQDGSIVYAGDVPEGSRAQLMRANMNSLIEGAEHAAIYAQETTTHTPDFALLVSCVGRKLVLKKRTDEELEAVESVLGRGIKMSGFYSYGEIAPVKSDGLVCELHNQTMTITTITELE